MDPTQRNRTVELVELIQSLGYDCALVGGLAVSVRTRPRATQDIDVAVAVTADEDAERVGFELSEAGYRLRDTLENTGTGYISTLRFNHPRDAHDAQEPTIDVLFSTCGIEREIVDDATPIRSSSGAIVRVAQVPHLIAMKTLSERDDRAKDREDLQALVRVATKAQLDEARTLLSLIEKRGYNRNKDLSPLLESFIERHQSHDQDSSR
ncbi:MAG: putative nucleotidyltransferase [Planctomycetota bacterium]